MAARVAVDSPVVTPDPHELFPGGSFGLLQILVGRSVRDPHEISELYELFRGGRVNRERMAEIGKGFVQGPMLFQDLNSSRERDLGDLDSQGVVGEPDTRVLFTQPLEA